MGGYELVAPGPGARESILGTGSARTLVLNARALTTNAQLISMGGLLMGWCMRETTGSAGAVVELYDGQGTSAMLIGTQGLGNGTSGSALFSDLGVEVESGVYAHVVTGTADVIVYFRADTGGY